MRGRLIRDSRPLVLHPGAAVGAGVEDRLGHALGIAHEADVAALRPVAERERPVAEQAPAEAVADAGAVNAGQRHRLPGAPHGAARGDHEDAARRQREQRAIPLPDGAREAQRGARRERERRAGRARGARRAEPRSARAGPRPSPWRARPPSARSRAGRSAAGCGLQASSRRSPGSSFMRARGIQDNGFAARLLRPARPGTIRTLVRSNGRC